LIWFASGRRANRQISLLFVLCCFRRTCVCVCVCVCVVVVVVLVVVDVYANWIGRFRRSSTRGRFVNRRPIECTIIIIKHDRAIECSMWFCVNALAHVIVEQTHYTHVIMTLLNIYALQYFSRSSLILLYTYNERQTRTIRNK